MDSSAGEGKVKSVRPEKVHEKPITTSSLGRRPQATLASLLGPWAQHQSPGVPWGRSLLTPQGNESPASCSQDGREMVGRWILSSPLPGRFLKLENHSVGTGH